MRIGLPRALLYYWFGPAWKAFLQEIRLMPVVSRMTTKEILKQGVRVGVDEACLPVKVYLGHCLNLMSECDLLLVPRIVNLRKKEFICPKFMGLPEMVKAAVTNEYGPEGKERVLVWKSEHRSFWDAPPALPDYLRKLAGPGKIKTGLHRAKQVFREYRALLHQGYLPDEAEEILAGKNVHRREQGAAGLGVIGHPYCLYDHFLNMSLLTLLQRREYNYAVFTPELFSEEELSAEVADLAKPIFWTLGRRMLGAVRALRKKHVAGIIHLAAFACGPEALIGELIRRECQSYGLPLLQINLDEHSGEAGLLTRIEAFLDLINTHAHRKEGIGCG